MIESLYWKWLTSFRGVYTEIKVIFWFIGAGTCRQGSDTDNGCKQNMKPKVMKLWNRLILRKRFIIETVFNQRKNISQIEHSRHRSCIIFMANLLAWLIAYSFQPKKPSIKITRFDK
uniref:transposase n=2 Tax=Candidatus Enterovibrio escicola TaxID=1927127 RepID=UPI001CC2243A|nr:transposase [Candidatus Enterovibrio escacola]